jgi:hypothetical protein
LRAGFETLIGPARLARWADLCFRDSCGRVVFPGFPSAVADSTQGSLPRSLRELKKGGRGFVLSQVSDAGSPPHGQRPVPTPRSNCASRGPRCPRGPRSWGTHFLWWVKGEKSNRRSFGRRGDLRMTTLTNGFVLPRPKTPRCAWSFRMEHPKICGRRSESKNLKPTAGARLQSHSRT